MRACFLGQNICALGNGVAIVRGPMPSEQVMPKDRDGIPKQTPAEDSVSVDDEKADLSPRTH